MQLYVDVGKVMNKIVIEEPGTQSTLMDSAVKWARHKQECTITRLTVNSMSMDTVL